MTTTTSVYNTPDWKRLRRQRLDQAARQGEPCGLCGEQIDYTLNGRTRWGPTVHHTDPLGLGGEVLPTLSDLEPAHNSCNARHGAVMQAQMKGKKVRPIFDSEASEPRARPSSLGVGGSAPRSIAITTGARILPRTLSARPRSPGKYDGLPVRFPPEPHPEAVASLGDEFCAFAEARTGRPLLWWQWVAAQRAYEVRADGGWCWPLVLVSVVRQQGKSAWLTEDAIWWCDRSSGGELVLSSANSVTTSRMIQSTEWDWAEQNGLEVSRLLGESKVVWPNGSQWVTVATGNAYGRRPSRLLADEAWHVSPDRFWDALVPALGAHANGQIILFSAPNDADRGLGRQLRSRTDVLVLEWGALPGEDPADPATWAAASAYMFPGRENLMKLAVGQPGFATNWLGLWPEDEQEGPEDWLDRDGWDKGRGTLPMAQGAVVGVLEMTADGLKYAAAAGWSIDGQTFIATSDYLDSQQQAVAWLDRWRPRTLLVGVGLVKMLPRMRAVVVPYGARETQAATPVFARMVADGQIRHDGTWDEEAWSAVVEEREGGISLSRRKSTGPTTRLKAALWLSYHLSRNDYATVRPRIFA